MCEVWAEGDRVRDAKTGKPGTVVQVTGPAPFIYRVLVEGDAAGGAPIMIYRYGDQLRRVSDCERSKQGSA
ncbi:hypothetical protein ACQEU8_30705 [Streptomyces sp. CA-250714]|uniref:hypothetical protein n=1 Tax=Streptomyces sp. CA-250714 TaxID=3240060 RepID=UPI003D8B4275